MAHMRFGTVSPWIALAATFCVFSGTAEGANQFLDLAGDDASIRFGLRADVLLSHAPGSLRVGGSLATTGEVQVDGKADFAGDVSKEVEILSILETWQRVNVPAFTLDYCGEPCKEQFDLDPTTGSDMRVILGGIFQIMQENGPVFPGPVALLAEQQQGRAPTGRGGRRRARHGKQAAPAPDRHHSQPSSNFTHQGRRHQRQSRRERARAASEEHPGLLAELLYVDNGLYVPEVHQLYVAAFEVDMEEPDAIHAIAFKSNGNIRLLDCFHEAEPVVLPDQLTTLLSSSEHDELPVGSDAGGPELPPHFTRAVDRFQLEPSSRWQLLLLPNALANRPEYISCGVPRQGGVFSADEPLLVYESRAHGFQAIGGAQVS